MKSFSFPKHLRLRKRNEFAFLSKKGRGFAGEKLVCQWMRTESPYVRLGLTVSGKTGSAVERNLFKRRVREAFRICPLKTRNGIDLNVRPQKTLKTSFQEILLFFNQIEKYLFGVPQK
jgi:ribonuclease P protein component